MTSLFSGIAGIATGNPLALGVAGLSALSSLSGGSQQQDQAEQVAATARANAAQSIANMGAIEAQASAQELAQRRQSGQYLGRQAAALADSGTGSIGSGSNMDVLRQSAYDAEIDALNTRYQGELRGSQYLQGAYNYLATADAAEEQASQLGPTKFIGAATSALTSFASSYAKGIKGLTNISTNGLSTATGKL